MLRHENRVAFHWRLLPIVRGVLSGQPPLHKISSVRADKIDAFLRDIGSILLCQMEPVPEVRFFQPRKEAFPLREAIHDAFCGPGARRVAVAGPCRLGHLKPPLNMIGLPFPEEYCSGLLKGEGDAGADTLPPQFLYPAAITGTGTGTGLSTASDMKPPFMGTHAFSIRQLCLPVFSL